MARRCLLLVLLMAVSFNIASGQFNSEALLFPEDTPFISTRRNSAPIMEVRTTTTPACADGTVDPFGINPPCIEDSDYNDFIKQRIALLLNQDRSLNEIVSNPDLKIILNDTLTPAIGPGSPTTRFGGSSETPVCAAREELIFPMRAKTPKGDWVFVVNQDNVKQALRVERCATDGGNCDFGTSIRSESRPVCRQKYVYRRMLVLGSNAVGPEEVLMPSCCVCYMVFP